jgi:nucleotide-binding universal stress UspA family protein
VENHYKHILVPLDSSELAELALPHASVLARLNRAQLTLLHILRPIDHVIEGNTPHTIFVDEQQEVLEGRALQYLRSISDQLTTDAITVHTVVEVGSPAETIIHYATENQIDLIVMCSHGCSGVRRWVLGSVTDKVLRGTDVPVLLVRADVQRRTASPDE